MKNRRSLPQFLLVLMLFVMPASTTYEMHDYGFGAGGVGVSTSTTYGMTGMAGEAAGDKGVGTTYNMGPGLQFTRQSNVPAAPTFTNPASYYNKLKFVLDTGSNPSDTLFAVAISSDNFTTTNYVQADNTVGASAVYQTYATWGGASGANVIGLSPGTTYKMKTKAVQTKYTETEFSATATAATVTSSLTYDIDVNSADTETAAPYALSLGTLAVNTVTTATSKIWIDLDTNADSGGFVYVYNSGTGLTSSNASYTITSATANLSAASEGYGIRVNSTTQSSGGPLAAVSPYDGTSENVGVVNATTRTVFNSSNVPITAGRGSLLVKAKISGTTPAASDYTGIMTLIASATF